VSVQFSSVSSICARFYIDDGLTAAAAAAAGMPSLLPSISSLRHVDLLSDSVTLEWEASLPPAATTEPAARHRLKSYVVERYVV